MDFMVFAPMACALVIAGLVAFAAVVDVGTMRISNRLVLAVLGITVMQLALQGQTDWAGHLLGGGIMLVVTVALFFGRIIGGGDAKLLAVLGLWLGASALMPFLLVMTLCGAALGLLGLWLMKSGIAKQWAGHRLLKNGWIRELADGKPVTPYGVAIGGAVLVHVISSF